MNSADREYFKLLTLVLEKGRIKKNRTATDTLGTFGAQARFDLSEGFPLITTKKVFFKGIIHELLWFLSGSTNIKYLVDNGVTIWNKDAYRRYCDVTKANTHNFDEWLRDNGDGTCSMYTYEQFCDKLKGARFCEVWGELGEGTYGSMWRGFPYYESEPPYHDAGKQSHNHLRRVDQFARLIEKLKTNPDDRRLIVSAWHPYWVEQCVLPPCHVLFQFHTEELTIEERWKLNRKMIGGCDTPEQKAAFCDSIGIPKRRLNLQLYQRSCDLFLGVPFNIASYALLLEMVAQVVNMVPGEFIHTYGDLHLYTDHLDKVKEQLLREPRELPTLKLNPEIKNLLDFKFEDITLVGYEPHPPIKAEMST